MKQFSFISFDLIILIKADKINVFFGLLKNIVCSINALKKSRKKSVDILKQKWFEFSYPTSLMGQSNMTIKRLVKGFLSELLQSYVYLIHSVI